VRRKLLIALLPLVLGGALAAVAPGERVLGRSVGIVYLHGAWVWTAIACLGMASVAALVGWLTRSPYALTASMALGQTGTAFWVTYLPLSLWTMQSTWGGLYLVEPRWRLGVNFAFAAVLVQGAILLVRRPPWAAALNTLLFVGLAISLASTPSVLHPESPVFSSGSLAIMAPFLAILVCCLASAWQLAAALQVRVA
jgi:hypothetical protein